MKIKAIKGREILDSRGMPTIECVLTCSDGVIITASVPSGASVGHYEAHELRDNDPEHFMGKGVLKAINNLETKIAPLIIGKYPDSIKMDQDMILLDNSSDKSNLGANAILAASIAIIRAQAHMEGVQLFELINDLWQCGQPEIPRCMFNVINGGIHADSGLRFQEFMIVPEYQDFRQNLEYADLLYIHLKKIFHEAGYSVAIGDEGGFAPQFKQHDLARENAALDFLVQAIKTMGDHKNINICLDIAASQFYDKQEQKYRLYEQSLSATELINVYEKLCAQYPIISIEDGLAEDDWVGWQELTMCLGSKIQLVGDDLFVTNKKRIEQGIKQKVANAVLIKPNQIGTVLETIQAIKLCKQAGYKTIVSHRSGETNDTFIADLAVGTAAGQMKAGAPVRGERVAKYNRLLEIQELLLINE